MTLIATCGKKSLHLIDAQTGEQAWSLIWDENTSIPADEKSWLAWYNSGTDDIKPINNNQSFLISSVCGLLAEVERASNDVSIIGWAPGAHSIEALDGDFVAAAISHKPSLPPGAPDVGGDQFQLYDKSKPGPALWTCEAYGAHGVIWDKHTQLLWALDYHQLHSFTLNQSLGTLEKQESWDLPGESGHDLNWYDAQTLFVTTAPGVYLFDMNEKTFRSHPQLATTNHVKGISRHPHTGETIYCFPDPGDQVFTSADLHFIEDAQRKLTAPYAVYKPRWLID